MKVQCPICLDVTREVIGRGKVTPCPKKMCNSQVFQTEMEPGKGNCFSACLATYLGLHLDEVPNFREKTRNSLEYLNEVQNWLKQFDIYALVVRMDTEELSFYPVPDGVIVIAGGKSPRFGDIGIKHACLGRMAGGYNFELIHDPYPGGTGFEKPEDITSLWFLIDFNISDRPYGV
jgi:hypothetical protein